jgi:hypothetical protein
MSNEPPFARAKPGFTSFKCREPIPYPNRWQRHALVQATLEPTVTAIAAPQLDLWRLPAPISFAYCCWIAGNEFLVVVAEREVHHADLPGQHPAILRITRRSLGAEPIASVANSIWAHKRFQSDPADRMRVIDALTDLPRGKPAAEIHPLLQNPFLDPIRQLFSMLANGYLVADLNSGFTPRTHLRLGPAAIGEEPVRPRDRLLSLPIGVPRPLSPIPAHPSRPLSASPAKLQKPG